MLQYRDIRGVSAQPAAVATKAANCTEARPGPEVPEPDAAGGEHAEAGPQGGEVAVCVQSRGGEAPQQLGQGEYCEARPAPATRIQIMNSIVAKVFKESIMEYLFINATSMRI